MATEQKKDLKQNSASEVKPKYKPKIDRYDDDPVLRIFAQYAPECLDESTDWYEYIGDKTMGKAYYDGLGYKPVLNEKGEHVHYKDEPLYKRQLAAK